jgi:hypothetical protein
VEADYDLVSLDIQGDQATAQVTREPPVVTSLQLQKIDQDWQIRP